MFNFGKSQKDSRYSVEATPQRPKRQDGSFLSENKENNQFISNAKVSYNPSSSVGNSTDFRKKPESTNMISKGLIGTIQSIDSSISGGIFDQYVKVPSERVASKSLKKQLRQSDTTISQISNATDQSIISSLSDYFEKTVGVGDKRSNAECEQTEYNIVITKKLEPEITTAGTLFSFSIEFERNQNAKSLHKSQFIICIGTESSMSQNARNAIKKIIDLLGDDDLVEIVRLEKWNTELKSFPITKSCFYQIQKEKNIDLIAQADTICTPIDLEYLLFNSDKDSSRGLCMRSRRLDIDNQHTIILLEGSEAFINGFMDISVKSGEDWRVKNLNCCISLNLIISSPSLPTPFPLPNLSQISSKTSGFTQHLSQLSTVMDVSFLDSLSAAVSSPLFSLLISTATSSQYLPTPPSNALSFSSQSRCCTVTVWGMCKGRRGAVLEREFDVEWSNATNSLTKIAPGNSS